MLGLSDPQADKLSTNKMIVGTIRFILFNSANEPNCTVRNDAAQS
jgi:hypothetical protein